MKIALIGTGNMGDTVSSLARKARHEIVVSIDESQRALVAADLAEHLSGAEAAIDFSASAAVFRNVKACMLARIPLVEGTTGWVSQLEAVKALISEHDGAFVFGANFSIGVNLFYRITEYAAELFARFPEYEAFIEEQHHSRKKDAPSGTALKLAEVLAHAVNRDLDRVGVYARKGQIGERQPGEIGIQTIRAGDIVGDHTVIFGGMGERIEVTHRAQSRDTFVRGALRAARWVVKQPPGLYDMIDVLGLR